MMLQSIAVVAGCLLVLSVLFSLLALLLLLTNCSLLLFLRSLRSRRRVESIRRLIPRADRMKKIVHLCISATHWIGVNGRIVAFLPLMVLEWRNKTKQLYNGNWGDDNGIGTDFVLYIFIYQPHSMWNNIIWIVMNYWITLYDPAGTLVNSYYTFNTSCSCCSSRVMDWFVHHAWPISMLFLLCLFEIMSFYKDLPF